MKKIQIKAIAVIAIALAIFGGMALAQQDKYTLKVPGGLAFSEFRGYEDWQVVAISRNDKLIAVILANPVMIDAYRAGIPDNGRPFPRWRQDGEDPLESENQSVLPGYDGAGHPA